jgi:hypothetical protein
MSEGIYTPPPPPPPPPPPAPTGAGTGFDFGKPFTFLFEDPRWLNKVLMGGLFVFLSFLIVGWFFLLGYCARLTRNIVAGVERPLPEWDNLGEYFNEGLRLFGVALVYVLPIVAFVIAIGLPGAIMSAAENQGLKNLGGGLLGCSWCLIVPFALAITFFLPAALVRVSILQRFGAGFEIGELWRFIRENIGNYLLAIVVYLVARFLAGAGIVLLCIGVIFTGFWSVLIMTYGFAQAYKLAPRR